MVFIENNYIFSSPEENSYFVSSNYTNYIELGYDGIDDYYLKATVLNNKYNLSINMYDENGEFLFEVKNNVLINGENCDVINYDRGIIEIIINNVTILNYSPIENNTMVIVCDIYDKNGDLIARGTDENFLIFKGPARIGKKDNEYGIIINPNDIRSMRAR